MFPIDFCHIPVSIIKRSAGRSAVAAAAYRSGTKLTNEWDGMTHDYTRKGGIVHAEIMLPAHAPPEFADRSILWNSVEQIEKARDSQLAREIEAALPRELSGEQQLALVRAYVKDNFVDKGMCADFAIHDKGTGNPHVHIMLTLRPLKENGQWGAKCRKAYDLDENGQRIPDGKGGWKNHREDTTDWNDKGNVEIWRAAWAAYTNRALESAGRPERIDHRSYKRQGIDKIPSVHLGPAASQMEKRGIRTDKGEVNRQIAADNKLLKEIKARITRLYRWSKAEAEKPQTQQSSLTALWEAQQQLNAPRTRTGKIRALQESAALFSFLQANGIQSMQQLHEKIADMNSRYYDLRGKIVKAERRITTLTERGEMWEQYNQYKSIHKQLAKVKPEKREQFEQRHSREDPQYEELWAELLGGFAQGGGEVMSPDSTRTPTGTLQWPLPVAGTITSQFGHRVDPITGAVSSHTGTDIACAEGTPILAAADGTVTVANGLDSWGGSYGYYIQIDHGGGLETLYAHCSSICVTTDQQVQAGQVIGYVGHTGRATGSHLHLEVHVNGSRTDAMRYFGM